MILIFSIRAEKRSRLKGRSVGCEGASGRSFPFPTRILPGGGSVRHRTAAPVFAESEK